MIIFNGSESRYHGPRIRTSVVPDDGRVERDALRIHGRGIRQLHRCPGDGNINKTPSNWRAVVLDTGASLERARSADDVALGLRRAICQCPDDSKAEVAFMH